MSSKPNQTEKKSFFFLPQRTWNHNQNSIMISLKPGFHIVVSVVSVVRKKFIGQIQLYGNLPYKCSIQKKLQIQLVVRHRMNSMGPMNFFRTTDTTDTTDTTIWKPGLDDHIKPTQTRTLHLCHDVSESDLLQTRTQDNERRKTKITTPNRKI